MSGGSNSIKEGRPVVAGSQLPEVQKGFKENASGFQRVMTQNAPGVSGDPRTYLAGLGKITQSGELSFNQRFEAFRMITEQVISHPANPYSKIEKELREEMIESVAETLADSPRPLPRRVTRVA